MLTPDHAAARSAFAGVTRFADTYVQALSFLQVAELGEPLARTELVDRDHRHLLSLLQAEDPAASDPTWETISSDLADHALRLFRKNVGDAVVVFMHAALDAAVSDLLSVTALAAPDEWEQFIADRKVPLRSIREGPYHSHFKNVLEGYLDELAGWSLLKRVDRLCQVCRPGKDFNPKRTFVLDRDRLEQIDRYRHAVAHAHLTRPAIGPIPDEVKYLYTTGAYLWMMVNWRYRLDEGARAWS